MSRRWPIVCGLILACFVCATPALAQLRDTGVPATASLDELLQTPIPLRVSPASTQESESAPEVLPPNWGGLQDLYDKNIDPMSGEPATGSGTGTESLTLPRSPMDWSQRDLLRYLATLLALCGVIILLGFVARRLGRRVPALAGPALGKVLGNVHLAPKVALHYVHSGGRVLVIGVSPTGMSLITEFDAETFYGTEDRPADSATGDTRFRSLLGESLRDRPIPENVNEPDDIKALRGDIERLQQSLREGMRSAGE